MNINRTFLFVALLFLSISLKAKIIDIPVSYGDTNNIHILLVKVHCKSMQSERDLSPIIKQIKGSANLLYKIFESKFPRDTIFISFIGKKNINDERMFWFKDLEQACSDIPITLFDLKLNSINNLDLEKNKFLQQLKAYIYYLIIPSQHGYYSEINKKFIVFNLMKNNNELDINSLYFDQSIAVFVFHNISEICGGRDSLIYYLNKSYKEYNTIDENVCTAVILNGIHKDVKPLYTYMSVERKIPNLCIKLKKVDDLFGELVFSWENAPDKLVMPFNFTSQNEYLFWAYGEEKSIRLSKEEFVNFSYSTDFAFGSKTIYYTIQNNSCGESALKW